MAPLLNPSRQAELLACLHLIFNFPYFIMKHTPRKALTRVLIVTDKTATVILELFALLYVTTWVASHW
ncbi:uncharacterized protein BCR38DRAFT_427960 [Pseudomassariella vexata]|uniref:Uncharacterized protein n=1 Tax=Pseudomassariella vexata TaxID=1141098 RepID=A0A1Y2E815_9PEZI|nr:uncharacterized protein BCR38DRAFT_427960 [Pseudomassariella vexata]ORY67708.1 hypothetical protein BCR38DRAFT_427960 [Pseudomassariella vexata]